MSSISKHFLLTFTLMLPALTYGQCAPGIPGAGNPGCIPPTQPNSPYYHTAEGAPIKAPPQWADRWAAVALDTDLGKAGTILDQSSKSDAESIALENCRNDGGVNCKILISYHNQCAAVAQHSAGGKVFASSAYPQEQAQNRAMAQCGDSSCHLIYSECSLPQKLD